MKKIIAIWILIMFTWSCGPSAEERAAIRAANGYDYYRPLDQSGHWNGIEYSVRIIVIDSCEYIILYGVDGRSIVHKENCPNQYHNK